jgi:hypothetical protein
VLLLFPKQPIGLLLESFSAVLISHMIGRLFAESFYDQPNIKNPQFQKIPPRLDERPWSWCMNELEQDPPNGGAESFAGLASFHLAKFMEIVHDTVYAYYGDHKALLAPEIVLRQYSRYKNWKEGLPAELQPSGLHTLPHVLHLQ